MKELVEGTKVEEELLFGIIVISVQLNFQIQSYYLTTFY